MKKAATLSLLFSVCCYCSSSHNALNNQVNEISRRTSRILKNHIQNSENKKEAMCRKHEQILSSWGALPKGIEDVLKTLQKNHFSLSLEGKYMFLKKPVQNEWDGIRTCFDYEKQKLFLKITEVCIHNNIACDYNCVTSLLEHNHISLQEIFTHISFIENMIAFIADESLSYQRVALFNTLSLIRHPFLKLEMSLQKIAQEAEKIKMLSNSDHSIESFCKKTCFERQIEAIFPEPECSIMKKRVFKNTYLF